MKLSIIVPVYNVAPYLRDCLDSVRAQTFADWECICVDDGSTDESGAILDKYATKDDRFRVIHQANAGVSTARNVGLEIVTGDRVVFLDGDDIMLSDCLKVFSTAKDPVCFGRHISMGMKAITAVEWKRVDSISLELSDKAVWVGCYEREFIKGLRFRAYKWGEDHLFVAEVLSRVKSVGMSDAPLVSVRERLDSASRSPMSLERLRQRFGVEIARSSAFDLAQMPVDEAVGHRIGHSLVECFVRDVHLLPKAERRAAWRLWFDGIESLPANMVGKFSMYTRFALAISKVTRNRCIANVMCLYPLKALLWIKGAA